MKKKEQKPFIDELLNMCQKKESTSSKTPITKESIQEMIEKRLDEVEEKEKNEL